MPRRFFIVLTLLVLAVAAGVWLLQPQSPAPAGESGTTDAPPAAASPAAPNVAATTPPAAPAPAPSVAASSPPTTPPLAAYQPARPDAESPSPVYVPSIPNAPEPLAIPADFLDRSVTGNTVSFALPGGQQASGTIELIERDEHGVSLVQGRLTSPQPGFYFLHRQSEPGVAGAFFGHVRFDEGPVAFRLEPSGPGGSTQLVPRRIDEVICVGMPMPPEQAAPAAAQTAQPAEAAAETPGDPQHAPQTHPTNIPIPQTQNGIIPLQSLPGASAVVFLDFEGGPGPWPGWGNFPVLPAGASNSEIKEVWERVSEDFQPFNINVTTDRKTFEAAPKSSRQRVMVTPTNTASPGNGGVAFYGAFNSTADSVCWAFYTTGKNAAEVISHEVGHTLNLSHDGRQAPDQNREEYYGGHGSGDTGWAPIMGVGYSRVLSQWSKGEYAYATQTEDDLTRITNSNNTVAYRIDDYGSAHANAGPLEIFPNNSVSNEGIIERNTDVDAFRFESTGGSVSFTVTRVNAGPNLDIQASIHNSAGTQIVSSNPADSLNATVSASLAAGEYTLRVTGVGKGDATNGYTNYGSLGAYLITGTANGGVKPDRFSIAENSANGSPVGVVAPRRNHGGAALSYTITSGNTGGAFSINPSTGAITVANSPILDYEALSTRWDDPATLSLSVAITDASDPSLDETIRVVVTVSDVNEVPVITGGSQTIFSRTRIGTKLMTVAGRDPDRFDFPTFSIVGGNTGGAFAIDAATGQLSVATAVDVAQETTYSLTVRATDQLSPKSTVDTVVTIKVLPLAMPYTPGGISLTYYEDISGNPLSNLTDDEKFPANPDSLELASQLELTGHGDRYGAVFRGYLLVPTTGNYTFRLAADDTAILYISSTADPASMVQRGNAVTNATAFRSYISATASSTINLQAGTVRYIEVRLKEGVGDDHVSVAWQGPDMPLQIISGAYLAPFSQNYAPKVAPTTLNVRENAVLGATVGKPSVTELNETDTLSYALTGGTGVGRFAIEAATGRIYVNTATALAAGASYTLQVRVTDNGTPSLQGTGTVTIQVGSGSTIGVSGIVREIWRNFTGSNVSALTSHPGYPYAPSETRILSSFDAGSLNFGSFGSRIRAYVIPPTTGSYRFYISSDDQSELRLSSSANPAGATTPLASVSNWVDPRSWTAQASQTTAARTLTAGQRYYIEVRHRQGGGGDDLAVAWTGPGIDSPTVIPGSALEPFDLNASPTWTAAATAFRLPAGSAAGTAVGSLTATDPEGRPVTYAILSGNSDAAFAIHPQTGAITVATAAALSSPRTFTLSIAAQDDGLDGVYPLKSATRTITIDVLGPFDQWRSEKFGADYANTAISGDAADPDGDGLDNITEYALGREPRSSDRGGIIADEAVIDGRRHLRLTVTRNPAATGVALAIQSTGDPQNSASWNTATTTIEVDTPTTLQVRDNTPMDTADARFLRLKAKRE